MASIYNEDLYLNGNKASLIEFELMRKTRNEILDLELIAYKNILENYDLFIEEAAKLIKSLKLDSSLDTSLAIGYLIKNGYLSYNKEFNTEDTTIELLNKEGISIIAGEGCCRNFSDMQKSIMDKLGFKTKKFYCYQQDSLLASPKNEEANHVLNLIQYKDNIYGIDIYNHNLLYRFINKFSLKAISPYTSNRLRYKPYCEMIRENKTLKDIYESLKLYDSYKDKPFIYTQDYEDYLFKINKKLENENERFNNFHEKTKELKKEIYNDIKG